CSLPNAASWLAASRCPVTRVLVGDWILAGSALAPCSEVRSSERACLAGIAAEMAKMARDTPRVRRIFIRSGLHVGLQHRASAADPSCAPSRIDGRTVAVGVVPGPWAGNASPSRCGSRLGAWPWPNGVRNPVELGSPGSPRRAAVSLYSGAGQEFRAITPGAGAGTAVLHVERSEPCRDASGH